MAPRAVGPGETKVGRRGRRAARGHRARPGRASPGDLIGWPAPAGSESPRGRAGTPRRLFGGHRRRSHARTRPGDVPRLGLQPAWCPRRAAQPAPRRRVQCARARAPPNCHRTFWKRSPTAAPAAAESSPLQRASAAVEASGQGGGVGPARGRRPRGAAASDSPPPRRPRLSGAMAPPLPSSSMAPPRLIHSGTGLLDTCSQIPPPPPSSAVAAKMSGPTTDTPAAIQICR